MSNEMWRQIPHKIGYEVSTCGRIRNRFSGYVFTIRPKKNGMVSVNIGGRHFRVHRLVAEAFIDGFSESNWVVHKNGILSDNRADNLISVPVSDSSTWRSPARGNDFSFAKLNHEKVLLIRNTYPRLNFRQIGEILGCSKTTVERAYSGKTWSHVSHGNNNQPKPKTRRPKIW